MRQEEYIHHVRRESEAFLDAALAGSLDVGVPSCPGWTVADLVGHLGAVQRFHGGHLSRGVTDPPPGPRPSPPETGLAAWFREGLAALLATLQQVGQDTPAWNFLGAEPATTAFWHRRMAHEAAVHRWDVERARRAVTPFDQDLAVDGVDEVLQAFVPARRRPDGPEGTVVLRVRDAGVVRTVVHGRGAAGQAEAEGAAGDLLLAVWGRLSWIDLPAASGPVDLLQATTAA